MQLNDFSNKPDTKKSAELILVGPTFEKSKKFARDDKRAKSIVDLIMKMMGSDNQPFTLVEDRGCVVSFFSYSPGLHG